MNKRVDKADLRASVENLRDSLPELMQNTMLMAQITRAKYNALVKEGFTEAQAIELCRTGSAFS